jgi:hypothetical protein
MNSLPFSICNDRSNYASLGMRAPEAQAKAGRSYSSPRAIGLGRARAPGASPRGRHDAARGEQVEAPGATPADGTCKCLAAHV